jgi:threonine synthase
MFNYNLQTIADVISKQVLKKREDTFWKFLELLPVSSRKNIISLGEQYTPLIKLTGEYGTESENIFVKDDGRLPTGTFKARGMAVGVSALKELGLTSLAVPSAGNAGAALSAYGRRAGMKIYVFMPEDVPESILKECIFLGGEVYLVDGLINDAAKIVGRLVKRFGWFDFSTNKQPYRFEGYKATAFEIAEQFDWVLPDKLLFPTGGGEGIIGLWKGFKELTELGYIENIPELIAVQSSGCAPLVKAFENGKSEVKEAWKDAETIAAGLRVPLPFASYLVLRAIKETNGMAISVDEDEIISSMKTFFKHGIYACPEATVTLAAFLKLESKGIIESDEKTLLYVTGSALKHLDIMRVQRDSIKVLGKDAVSLT